MRGNNFSHGLLVPNGFDRLQPGGLTRRVDGGRERDHHAGNYDEEDVRDIETDWQVVHEVDVWRNLDDFVRGQKPTDQYA